MWGDCKGITRHYTYWWQSSAVLKTDHSPSMFPPLDVVTRVLPLTEHKRGLFPPNQNHLPQGPDNWLVLSLDLLGERKRERLLFGQTSGPAPGLVHETKSGAGILTLHIPSYNPGPCLHPFEQDPIFFNYVQETPVTKDTFLVNLQGGCEEFWGHPPVFSLFGLSY